jgi:PAS domain S-box-containing protein
MALPFKQLAPQDVLEAYYANVQRSETIHMVMLNTSGVVTAANRATARLFGKTPDDLVGTDWIATTASKELRDEMHRTFDRLLATGLPDVSRDNLLLPDGKHRTMLWSHSLTHTDATLTGVLSFGIDITEYAHEHELLAKAEEVAGLGTYVLDITTGVWSSSAILDGIFGIDAAYPHTVSGWLALVHPDEKAALSDYFNSHVLIQHKQFDRSYRIIRQSDGAVRRVLGFGKLEFSADGSVSHMLGTIQDITQRHAADEGGASKQRESELETMRRAMLGRELRISELKAELDRLKATLVATNA